MKLKYIIIVIYVVVAVVVLSLWLGTIPSSNEQHNLFIESYRIESYSGNIVKKFVDKEQHGYRTIVVDDNNTERSILLEYEKGGLYSFLNVGDSINKKEGDLSVSISRENIDTIIHMRFTNI